jgi:hypothetical protein
MTTMPLARNMTSIGRLDIPGGGQISVHDGYAYIGHMKPPHGTSIIDVRNPKDPKLVSTIALSDETSHTHKLRVNGDIMITNVEQNERHALRRGLKLREAEARLSSELGRPPSEAELATALNVPEDLMARVRRNIEHGYKDGGFKVWDVSDKAKPRELAYVRTGGVGVHRFDADERYAYISTEMDGFQGNILVVYDMADPTRPAEVSRWWMPGQNLAAGETPFWAGQRNRLHHAMRFGNELWAAVWYAGVRVIDCSDITNLKTIGEFNYHPPFPEPTHTVVPVPTRYNGRQVAVAVDEEHDHVKGQLHGGLWLLDVENRGDIKPLGMFHLSEMDSPYARTGARFGAHQFQERVEGDRLYCAWFGGGLRVIDIKDPTAPEEVGWYIPEPFPGQKAPQSNDVYVENGLVYVLDRNAGLDIVEPAG